MKRILALVSLWLALAGGGAQATQATWVTPGSPLPMTGLKTFLDGAMQAIGTCNSGPSAPTVGPAGSPITTMCWWNTVTTPWVFNVYDGTQWDPIFSVNSSTHSVQFSAATTINGVSCTLGGSCSVTATASSMTINVTTVLSGTSGRVLYDNAGVLGEATVTGSLGSVVLSASPTLTGTINAVNITLSGVLKAVAPSSVNGNTAAAPLGIGAAPVLVLQGQDNAGANGITIYNHSAGGSLDFATSLGTGASPTLVTNGTVLGFIRGNGYDGANYDLGAYIAFAATQDFSATHNGSQIKFFTTANNSISHTLALTIGQDQSLAAAGPVSASNLSLGGTLTTSAALTTTGAGTPTLAFPSSGFIYTFPGAAANLAYQVGSIVSGNCLQASGTAGGIADSGSPCGSGSPGVASLGNATSDTTLTIAGTGSGPWTGAVTIKCTVATTSQVGCVKPDGTIITDTAGLITVAKATPSLFGVVEGDGATLSLSGGVISLNVANVNTWTASQTFAAGTVTATTRALTVTATFNNASAAIGAPLLVNVTNTASQQGSTIAEFQVGGNDVMAVYTQDGTAGGFSAPQVLINAGAPSGQAPYTGDWNSHRVLDVQGLGGIINHAYNGQIAQLNLSTLPGSTLSSPTAVTAGTSIGVINMQSIDGSAGTSVRGAAIGVVTLNNWSSSDHSAYMNFQTVASGSAAPPVTGMRLQASGGLTIGSAIVGTDPGSGNLLLAGNLQLTGSSSGTATLQAPATGGGTATLFAGSDTVAGKTVANGGTNCSAASGTCLDNITGFSSTGFIKRTGAGTYTFIADPSDVTSVFGRTGAVVATSGDYTVGQVTGAAPLASPTFTGTVTMPDGGTLTSAANNFAAPTTITSASFGLTGNISAAAWTTNGIRYKNVAATLTDTTSSGTVSTVYNDVWGGNTNAASSATTYTQAFGSYFKAPIAGTNVVFTNSYAVGMDSFLAAGSSRVQASGATGSNAAILFTVNTTTTSNQNITWTNDTGSNGSIREVNSAGANSTLINIPASFVINSASTGGVLLGATGGPLVLYQGGSVAATNKAITITSPTAIAFNQYTTPGIIVNDASGNLTSSTAIKPGANNHSSYGGSAPAVSACGTSPAIDGNATDSSGTVTVGSVATGCTITFASAYTTFNHCKITSQSAVSGLTYVYTKTAITISASVLGGDVVDYVCDGV